MTILSDVKALGQQIWLDNLSRSLVQSGELAEMLKQGVCGVTSNPAIFQKAFAGDALYADEVAALKQQDLTPKQRYETMAVADVQAACDVCLAEHESTGGKTGFVSLEVSPELSKDAQGTVEEARRLHAAIGRKNAMIKVPATDEGIEALETLVSDGISINLTLLFSRTQTLKAYAAYARGIANVWKQDTTFPISKLSPASLFPVSMPHWTPPCPTTSKAKSPLRWPKPPIKIGRNTSAAANLPHLPNKVPTAYNFCGHLPA